MNLLLLALGLSLLKRNQATQTDGITPPPPPPPPNRGIDFVITQDGTVVDRGTGQAIGTVTKGKGNQTGITPINPL